MGNCATGEPEVLHAKTHHLDSRPTGTLIFTANEHEKSGKSSDDNHSSLILGDNEFYGLNVQYDDIEVNECIGSGSYGQVFKARYKGKRIALKKIFLSDVPIEKKEVNLFTLVTVLKARPALSSTPYVGTSDTLRILLTPRPPADHVGLS